MTVLKANELRKLKIVEVSNDIPQYKSKVQLFSVLVFEFVNKKPNAWWRFWQYVLLGFTWEDVTHV